MMRNIFLACCCVLLSCAVLACKDENAGPPSQPAAKVEPQTAAPPTPPPAPPPVPNVTVAPDANGVVHLTADDQMRFNANRIEAKAGQKLKVELKNAGALPKQAMGHDFVLLQSGSDLAAFGTKAATARDTDYLPSNAPEVLAHTKLLGPGESDTVELPDLKAGTYPFLCSFPGHYALMKGELVVAP
jgi:azurin